MTQERKYILIGGLILLLAGAVYRFYPDIQAVFAGSNDTFLKEKRLAKYRKMVAEKDLLQSQLVEINRALVRAESGLLNGTTFSLAAVDVQNLLNDIAGQTRVTINSIRVMTTARTPDADPDYIPVPVQVTLAASVRQLKEMFYRIETSPKLLKIKDMQIRLPNVKSPETVQATFTVEGFMKGMDAGQGS